MLRHLLRVLTETIDAWKEFKSKNGDIQYFSCLISTHMNDQSHNAQDSLQAISDTFNELVKLEGKLRFHEKSFLDCADAVSYFPIQLSSVALLGFPHLRTLLTLSHTAQASNGGGKQESGTT